MALNKEALKSDLKTRISAIKVTNDNPDGAIDALCSALSDAIDTYVKTATVTVQPGQTVTTPAGPGSTSSQGTGSLS